MRVFAFASLLFLSSAFSHSASGQSNYYVTIGVYGAGKQDYAVNYTHHANKLGFSAQYAINPAHKRYYVFLLQTDDFKKAISFMIRLRAESEFKDAWVFVGNLGEAASEPAPNKEPVEAVTKPEGEPNAKPVTEPAAKPVTEPVSHLVVAAPATETKPAVKHDSAAVAKPAEKKVAKGKFFTFEFLNDENGNEVRGEVHVQESKYSKQYQAFKANEMVDLLHPKNVAGTYFIATIAPGYKAFETTINYKDPSASVAETGSNGEMVIRIHLVRAKRGDYVEFNSVGFYRNSVIMQPSLKVELDGLADLMKEHVNYRVRIHGHCNGNEPRNIVSMGKSTKFFESDAANHKGTASARELTELRAESTKAYLVSQGIAAERIEVKGEGGKMMVYPSNSVYANYNDRVEIEIIRH
jgi:outer membrane protein OmpA-like peptidoglycan-associated protein